MRILGYLVCCLLAVIGAQIGAWILTFVLAFANITDFGARIVGPDLATSLLGWVGRIIFAFLFGVLIKASLDWYRPGYSGDPSFLGGSVAAILGFIFPLFTAGAIAILLDFDPRLLAWAADERLRVVVVFASYALVGGLIALAVASVIEAVKASARGS